MFQRTHSTRCRRIQLINCEQLAQFEADLPPRHLCIPRSVVCLLVHTCVKKCNRLQLSWYFVLKQRPEIPDEIAKVERELRQEIKRRQAIERKLQRLLEVRKPSQKFACLVVGLSLHASVVGLSVARLHGIQRNGVWFHVHFQP